MIVIIADDLSGAAELAGLAAARGFQAEVQTDFDPTCRAEVIAVDTDTRLMPENEAKQVVHDLARRIAAAKPRWIYKKTDSALRGHVSAEIESILSATGLDDCLLIPANPSKGRIVREGAYLIDGVPLDQTVFAADPDHPRRSSSVRELLGESDRIRTPDACRMEDLPGSPGPFTLAAGAADFFASLLPAGIATRRRIITTKSLLLSGSLAAWDQGRATEMQARGFLVKTLDEAVSTTVWQDTDKLMLAIGRPARETGLALTERLVAAALPLIADQRDLRIGLEGGATAMAFLRPFGWTRFEVIPEGHVGVGTLRPPGGPVLCVKPGSYPWPEECL
jgi:uncharacterized protein YgbK (DUF1537 family)